MDIGLGDASAFLDRWGFPVFVSVVSLGLIGYIVRSFSVRIEALAKAITILANNVEAPYNDVPHSMIIYNGVMKEAVVNQIKYIGDILYENSVIERRDQIKANIAKEFAKIHQEAASKLTGFKSVCGDMGKYFLDYTDMEKVLNPIYFSIFGDKDTYQKVDDKWKIRDIKTHLYSHIAEIWMELEQNGVSN